MASGTEATDDWCENQCAAYGCEEDAQKVCKCSARHTAQQPEAAEGPADGDEVTIHHDVKGEEEADADEQAMASWAGAPLSSDEQAEQSRKQAEKDARAVEAANEAQRKAVEAEAKKIAAAGEASQMDVARTEAEERDVAKGLAEAAAAAARVDDAERAAQEIAPEPGDSGLQATEVAPQYVDDEGALIDPDSICVSIDPEKVS